MIPFTHALVALTDLPDSPEASSALWSLLSPWLVRVLSLLQRSKSAAEKFLQMLEGAARRNEGTLRELTRLRKDLSEVLKVLELRFLDSM